MRELNEVVKFGMGPNKATLGQVETIAKKPLNSWLREVYVKLPVTYTRKINVPYAKNAKRLFFICLVYGDEANEAICSRPLEP